MCTYIHIYIYTYIHLSIYISIAYKERIMMLGLSGAEAFLVMAIVCTVCSAPLMIVSHELVEETRP